MTDQVVFFAGGSAFRGTPISEPVNYVVTERVQIWISLGDDQGFFSTLFPGFNNADSPRQLIGPEVEFASNWLANNQTGTLYMGKFTPGLSYVAEIPNHRDWSPNSNGDLFDAAADIVNGMLRVTGHETLDAVFFFGGGVDGLDYNLAQNFEHNLTNLFEGIRAEWMHDEDGYIGFARSSDLFGVDANGNSRDPDANLLVRQAQWRVDQLDENAESLKTVGLEMSPGNEVFTQDATNFIGHTLYDNWIS